MEIINNNQGPETERYGRIPNFARKKPFESIFKGHPEWVDALLMAGVSRADVNAELGRLTGGNISEITPNDQP